MNEQIRRYQNLVRAIVKKLTGSQNEDLEQDIYIKAWEKRETYTEKGKAEAWLGALAANTVKDYFKSRFFNEKRKTTIDAEKIDQIKVASSVEQKIDAKKRQKIILKAVNELPSKLKKVIILYEFEEKSYLEIAEKLNLPVGTIKSRLSSARKILAEKLKFLKGDNYE